MMLKKVNSLGEYRWEDKSKHISKITEKDVRVISKVLSSSISEQKKVIEELCIEPESLNNEETTLVTAVNQMKLELDSEIKLLAEISDPKRIDEVGWNIIFTMLVKEDDEDFSKFVGKEPREPFYYEQLRDTTYRVSLISGISTSNKFTLKDQYEIIKSMEQSIVELLHEYSSINRMVYNFLDKENIFSEKETSLIKQMNLLSINFEYLTEMKVHGNEELEQEINILKNVIENIVKSIDLEAQYNNFIKPNLIKLLQIIGKLECNIKHLNS